MTENQIQLLILLNNYPDGLSTSELFEKIQDEKYNGIKDIKCTSNLVFNMRKSELISSHDLMTGKIHKITAKGKSLLSEQLKLENDDHMPPAIDRNTDAPRTPSAYETGLLTCFDESAAQLRAAIQAAIAAADLVALTSAEPWPKMPDKQAKIELLEKFENMPMFEAWVVDMLGEIRQFIAQFDSE